MTGVGTDRAKINAAMLEVGRIVSVMAQREREMWLRFARQVREMPEGRVGS